MYDIWVPQKLGDKTKMIKTSMPDTKLVTRGEWGLPTRMENMPIAIYGNDEILKEVITRTGRPVSGGGNFWAYKYRGRWFSTCLDPNNNYGIHVIGKQIPTRKGGSHR
jgi:hypothetical protein